MRKLSFEYNGETVELAANFAASVDLSEKGIDPLFVAREAAIEAAVGPLYQPKFRFTGENIADAIAIGLKCSGDKRGLSFAKDLVFDIGFKEAQDIAARYIALFIVPRSESLTEKDNDDAGE